MSKSYVVTGVFVPPGPGWHPVPVERTVEAPYPEWAISIVHCEALKANSLFLSAKAAEVTS